MKITDLISRSAVLKTVNEVDISDCTDIESIIDRIYGEVASVPAIDAVPVVRCKDCASHGHCTVEDMFTIFGFADGYCRAGKRVSNVVSGARMDGESEEDTDGS